MLYNKINTLIPDSGSVWIMYSAEGSDPYFKKFITDKTIVPAVCLINRNKTILIVHGLDADNLNDFPEERIIYENRDSLVNEIKKSLKFMNMPENIYLNYSDSLDTTTDVLGFGVYSFLHDNIKNLYENENKKACFNSADSIIYSIMDKKTDEDIKYMKIAATRALQIIEDVFRIVKVGMTEKQIVKLFHETFNIKPLYFKSQGIVDETLSWEKSSCPIVLTGPNLAKGGHSTASDKHLQRGDTIYFDFGVSIVLKNGKKYSSDIQRMGYALKDEEKCASEGVTRIFNTLVEAVNLGIKNCTPDKKGYEIDEIVRNHIINSGYPDYNHSTGHPVGEVAHAPGTSLAPKGHKRSEFFLQEGGVYTIEPRIQINNGGSIEEMVLVTKSGGKTLCPPQKHLYLI